MPLPKKPFTPEAAYTQAAARCATAEYCLNDWRRKFQMKGLPPRDIERVLDRLVDEGFINEARFVRAYVHDKTLYDRWGQLKIRQSLMLKRLPPALIEEALRETDRGLWEENLLDLLRQKRRSIKADTPFEERQKLLRFAAGRGYEPALIYQAVNCLCGEEGEEADEVFVEPDDEIVGPEEAPFVDNEF